MLSSGHEIETSRLRTKHVRLIRDSFSDFGCQLYLADSQFHLVKFYLVLKLVSNQSPIIKLTVVHFPCLFIVDAKL